MQQAPYLGIDGEVGEGAGVNAAAARARRKDERSAVTKGVVENDVGLISYTNAVARHGRVASVPDR